MEGSLVFRTRIDIRSDQSSVWDALINPEITQQYMFGCVPVTDWEVGSSLVWGGFDDGVDYVVGEVVAFDPESLHATSSFEPDIGRTDVPELYLVGDYHLSHADGLTTVQIVQGDFAQVEDGQKRFEEAEGAWSFALQKLKALLES